MNLPNTEVSVTLDVFNGIDDDPTWTKKDTRARGLVLFVSVRHMWDVDVWRVCVGAGGK